MMPPHGLAAIRELFGDCTDPAFEQDQIVRFALPYALVFTNAAGTEAMVPSARAHRLVAPVFQDVFAEIKHAGLVERATHYAGIFARRPQRGASVLSTHAWGIAIDLNPQENVFGTAGHMDPRVIAIFKDFGFTWGGEFHAPRCDPMHFQYASGY